MGKKLSCCRGGDSPYKQKDSQYNLTASEIKYDETVSSQLQHISDREPGDAEGEPTSDPRSGPLFVEKCSQQNVKSRNDLWEYRPLNKCSSCSTIYIDDCTVSHPNFRNMIKCVAMAVYYHIYNRKSEVILDIFDERLYPLGKKLSSSESENQEPDYRTIHRFMRTLFNSAQLSSECAIITLVYLERLLTYAEIDIGPSSWKRILLGAILLASKVWDDQAVWNVDYCQILRDMPIDDMNELERRFLELLQFNINVPSSIYVKYYFELRTLAEKYDLTLPAEPLNDIRAQTLEASSRACDHYFVNLRKNLKRGPATTAFPFRERA